jgi:histidyl-tRNA synthetase
VANPIQAIRGMNDILPSETPIWQQVETILRHIMQTYAYHEIRLPILEKSELFKRAVGEATDIVEKEMYTFLDRNEESLTLRPEGTAGCVRAGIEHGLLYNQIQRLWYLGPFFRHERPQKGRYRQFHQFGVETFGLAGPDIDAELILLSARILAALGLKPYVTLQLNSLGTIAARNLYREKLVAYLTAHQLQLDEDSQKRLTTNPLRILDSKNPSMQELIQNAPKLLDSLDSESKLHFEKLQHFLQSAGLSFVINPCLVRGLDYYSKTVFEWVTHELGAQGTVCAGGRYDGLIEQLNGKPTTALGFAMGMERIVLLKQQLQTHADQEKLDIYFMTDSDTTFAHGIKLAEQLRDNLPTLRLQMHSGGGSFKNQFKKADKSGALYALLLGEQEAEKQVVTLKYLREDKPQQTLTWDTLTSQIKALLR